MVAREHPEVIEEREWLIDTDVLDPDEEAEDGSIDEDCAYSYEQE